MFFSFSKDPMEYLQWLHVLLGIEQEKVLIISFGIVLFEITFSIGAMLLWLIVKL